MVKKKMISCCLAVCVAASVFVGCGNSNSDVITQNGGVPDTDRSTTNNDAGTQGQREGTIEGKVYFLNFKSELSSEWEETASAFTEETGIEMKVVTAGSGTYEQTLKSELSKKEMPTLFNINGPIGYQTWKEYMQFRMLWSLMGLFIMMRL